MARPRKNAAKVQGSLLAPDEVAEIPVEEQPYPLPEGWKWERGNSLWKPQETEKPTGEFFYYIDIDAVDNKQQKVISPKKIPLSQAPSRASRKLHEGDTIFSLVRPYLRNIAYIDEDISSCIASTGFYICSPLKSVNSRFLYWLMTSDYVVLGLNKFMKGDNSPSIRKNDIENFPFPLPPIDEQQRIVDRIESLFARLDEAKSKAEAVLDGFEIRKAAILHKAFTGELTERWREENKIQISSWKEESITSLCHSLKYGTAKKSKEIGSTVVLRMGNLQDGEIDWSNLAYSDDQYDIQKYLLFPNDVLFNRTNSSELVGKTAIYRGEYPAIYAGYLIKMNYKKNRLTGPYLNYVMNSHKAKEYCNNVKSDGVNQSNINAKKLGAFVISVPSLPEQQEIVRILDNLLAKERHIREAAENALSQIDLMKKAILARAFRGELGTHGSARDTLQNNGSM